VARLPTWEKVPLSKVTFADVGGWAQELSASHLSAASVRQAHRVFSLLLDHAVHDGRLARNTAKGVRLPRVSPAHMVFLTEPLTELMAGRGPDQPLFTAPGGGVLRNTNFRSRVFTKAKTDLGLGTLRIHDLRHTAATLAVAAGANVKVVQRMLGHASAAMTLDVYAGLFTDDLDSVAERLDAAAAQSRADSLRTADVLSLAEARTKKASQGADLHKDVVGPVGLEPTTYGLKVRSSTN